MLTWNKLSSSFMFSIKLLVYNYTNPNDFEWLWMTLACDLKVLRDIFFFSGTIKFSRVSFNDKNFEKRNNTWNNESSHVLMKILNNLPTTCRNIALKAQNEETIRSKVIQNTETSRPFMRQMRVCLCEWEVTRKEKVKFDLSSSPLLRPAVTAIILLNCSTANVNRKCSDPRVWSPRNGMHDGRSPRRNRQNREVDSREIEARQINAKCLPALAHVPR